MLNYMSAARARLTAAKAQDALINATDDYMESIQPMLEGLSTTAVAALIADDSRESRYAEVSCVDHGVSTGRQLRSTR